MGVHHGTLSRAARRDGWVIPPPPWAAAAAQEPPAPPSAPVSAPPTSGTTDHSRHAAEARRRASTATPPAAEQAAREWRCRRCGLRGFVPNRRADAWHSQALCDATVARLNAALDDRPKPFDVMTAQW